MSSVVRFLTGSGIIGFRGFRMGTKIAFSLLLVICVAASLQAQDVVTNPTAAEQPLVDPSPDYRFGPDDVVSLWVRDAPEISDKQFRVDSMGILNLPLAGKVRAEGLTRDQLEAELVKVLSTYIREPQVTINVASTRPMNVSILGGVRNPGTHTFRGTKNLLEMISAAGGLTPDASHLIRITRLKSCGELKGASIIEESTETTIGELDLTKVLESNPEQNIPICDDDVIFIPRMTMVYVIGEVARQGGFNIQDGDGLSVLQVLSLAGGVSERGVPEEAKILRPVMGGPKQAELPLDVKKILAGKAADVLLRPNDILFIPDSSGKGRAFRAMNKAISTSSSVLAWGALRALLR